MKVRSRVDFPEDAGPSSRTLRDSVEAEVVVPRLPRGGTDGEGDEGGVRWQITFIVLSRASCRVHSRGLGSAGVGLLTLFQVLVFHVLESAHEAVEVVYLMTRPDHGR